LKVTTYKCVEKLRNGIIQNSEMINIERNNKEGENIKE